MNNPILTKFEMSDFIIGERKIHSGDLSDIAGITGYFDEAVFFYDLKKSSVIPCESQNYIIKSKNRNLCAAQDNKNLPNVIVFGDSFGDFVSSLLKEKFKKYFYFHRSSTVKQQILLQEKPDYVIVEIVERSLSDLKKFSFLEK